MSKNAKNPHGPQQQLGVPPDRHAIEPRQQCTCGPVVNGLVNQVHGGRTPRYRRGLRMPRSLVPWGNGTASAREASGQDLGPTSWTDDALEWLGGCDVYVSAAGVPRRVQSRDSGSRTSSTRWRPMSWTGHRGTAPAPGHASGPTRRRRDDRVSGRPGSDAARSGRRGVEARAQRVGGRCRAPATASSRRPSSAAEGDRHRRAELDRVVDALQPTRQRQRPGRCVD